VIVGVTIGAVAKALLLCAKGGADMAKVKEAISGGFADRPAFVQVHGERMIERDFAPRGRIISVQRGRRHAQRHGNGAGAGDFDAPIAGLLETLYASASENGLSGMDQAAFFVELARRNGMACNRAHSAVSCFRRLARNAFSHPEGQTLCRRHRQTWESRRACQKSAWPRLDARRRLCDRQRRVAHRHVVPPHGHRAGGLCAQHGVHLHAQNGH
jgi:hypothetical protein